MRLAAGGTLMAWCMVFNGRCDGFRQLVPCKKTAKKSFESKLSFYPESGAWPLCVLTLWLIHSGLAKNNCRCKLIAFINLVRNCLEVYACQLQNKNGCDPRMQINS